MAPLAEKQMRSESGDTKEKYIENKERVDLDNLLVEEIGQIGKYQVRVMLLAAVVSVFAGFGNEYVFTTARTNTRCLIPQCDTVTETLEFAPEWILNAVPGTSETSFENCQRFGTSSNTTVEDASACPVTFFDQTETLPCEQFLYQNTNTVVYHLDLACDEWRRTFIGSMRTVGTFVGLPLTGYISDTWGRRTALVISSFNVAWIGIVRVWANTYVGFLALHLFEAMFGSSFMCAHILAMELVGPEYRVVTVAANNTFYSIGLILLGLLAWALPNWRHLTLALYVPQFLIIIYFWIMPESVRWYMSKGRFTESENILKKVAKANGKIISQKSLLALKRTAEDDRKAFQEIQSINQPGLFKELLRHKSMLFRCFVTGVWWMTGTLIYFGLSINVVNLSGNRYLNYAVGSAVEIPGFWIGIFIMNKIGRKPVIIVALWICAACQVGYIFTPEGLQSVTLTLFLISKFSIATVMASLYVYIGELYPTPYRHRFFAASSMIGRIGTFVAPLTPAFGDDVPYILFAAFALSAGALAFTVPETLGTKLPDTMEEAVNMGRKKNKVFA